jgi:hypothetical protein
MKLKEMFEMQIAKVDYRTVTIQKIPGDFTQTEYFTSLEAARKHLSEDKLGYVQKFSDQLNANSSESDHETWLTAFNNDWHPVLGEIQFQYEARITVYNTIA